MNLFFLTLLLFLSFVNEVHSQTRDVSGKIIDRDTKQGIAEAVIRNAKSFAITKTSSAGIFVLKADLKDTLLITAERYYPDTIAVSNFNNLSISLKKKTILLQEVNVVGKSITPLEKLERDKRGYKSIFMKGDKSKVVQLSGLGLSISVNKLYSALSKEGKDARKLQGILVNDYQSEIIDQRFNETLISGVTQLSGDRLQAFIFQYRPDFEWLENASDYELIQYIQDKMKLFDKQAIRPNKK